DKQNFAFVARRLVEAGITTVVANYELCPASTLDGVATSAIAAVDWVRREAPGFGGDPKRISISGHSAGAHLTAEALAHDWAAEGVDPSFI
ncbi:alpha/beta hydrolase, partial [Acinetobacter baumannii]